MGTLKLKHEQISSALDRLEEALSLLDKIKKQAQNIDFTSEEALYRTFRDSQIQRFEFSVDLFWKYLKRSQHVFTHLQRRSG